MKEQRVRSERPDHAAVSSQQIWICFPYASVQSGSWQDANLCSRVNHELLLGDCISEKKETAVQPTIVATRGGSKILLKGGQYNKHKC